MSASCCEETESAGGAGGAEGCAGCGGRSRKLCRQPGWREAGARRCRGGDRAAATGRLRGGGSGGRSGRTAGAGGARGTHCRPPAAPPALGSRRVWSCAGVRGAGRPRAGGFRQTRGWTETLVTVWREGTLSRGERTPSKPTKQFVWRKP